MLNVNLKKNRNYNIALSNSAFLKLLSEQNPNYLEIEVLHCAEGFSKVVLETAWGRYKVLVLPRLQLGNLHRQVDIDT